MRWTGFARAVFASLVFLAPPCFEASAAQPPPGTDVVNFDVDGIKLGLTADRVRPLVTALLAQNAIQNRVPYETPVDCRSGKPLGPAATQQHNASRRMRCVGSMQAAFGSSKIRVAFAAVNGDYGQGVVSSVELLEVVPVDGNDRAIPDAYLKTAESKFGKPTVSLSYDQDDRAYLIYCPVGTIVSACRQSPQLHESDLVDAKPEAIPATVPPASAYLLVSAGASAGDTWSLSVSLVDLRSNKSPPKTL